MILITIMKMLFLTTSTRKTTDNRNSELTYDTTKQHSDRSARHQLRPNTLRSDWSAVNLSIEVVKLH